MATKKRQREKSTFKFQVLTRLFLILLTLAGAPPFYAQTRPEATDPTDDTAQILTRQSVVKFGQQGEALYIPENEETCLYVRPGTDYTQLHSFEFAKGHTHTQLATFDCEYVDRAGINPTNAIEQMFGNVLVVTQSDLLSLSFLNYEQRVSRFWIVYEDDLNAWQLLMAQLPLSKSIRVTYDADCGLVTKVEILSWRTSW